MAQNREINSPYDEQSERDMREDGYSTYSRFGYPLQHYNQQQFMPYYGPTMRSMQMMPPPFAPAPAPVVLPTIQDLSGAQKKKNRWSDTEERILIELFGENEEKLRYKAFNSPEWQSIASQLHERCKEQENKTRGLQEPQLLF